MTHGVFLLLLIFNDVSDIEINDLLCNKDLAATQLQH